MAIPNFIFGGNTGRTYEDLQRERALAEQLLAQGGGGASSIGEGINRLGQTIGGAIRMGRANSGMKAGQQAAAANFTSLFGSPMGSPAPAPGLVPPMADNAPLPGPSSPMMPLETKALAAPKGKGSFTPMGNFVARGANKVDPRLVSILQEAAARSGMKVEAFSGYRPGDKRQHGRGKATDIRLIGSDGKPIPNYQSAKGFAAYQQLANEARRVQMEKNPELAGAFRWGGYFGGGKGKYGALDLMHFDLGGGAGLGMAGGSFEKGLSPQQAKLYGLTAGGGLGSQPAPQMAGPASAPAPFTPPIPAPKPVQVASLDPSAGLAAAFPQPPQAPPPPSPEMAQLAAPMPPAAQQAAPPVPPPVNPPQPQIMPASAPPEPQQAMPRTPFRKSAFNEMMLNMMDREAGFTVTPRLKERLDAYVAARSAAQGAGQSQAPQMPQEALPAPQAPMPQPGPQGATPPAAGPAQGSMGGMPSIQQLARAAADPFSPPETRAVAAQMLEQAMKAQDPANQLDLEMKRAQLQKLQAGDPLDTEYKRAQIAKLQADIAESQRPDARKQVGLTPIYGTDAAGNQTLLFPSSSGDLIQPKLPEGVKLSPGVQKVDLGTSWGILGRDGNVISTIPKDVSGEAAAQAEGKERGTAQVQAPAAAITAQQTVAKIDELLSNPDIGAISGWESYLPGPTSAAADLMAGRKLGATLGLRTRVGQLVGSAFLEAYNGLRGGGQITEVEGKKAEDAIARLGTAQTDADFRQALLDFREAVSRTWKSLPHLRRFLGGLLLRRNPLLHLLTFAKRQMRLD
jgi:hypothetical protein